MDLAKLTLIIAVIALAGNFTLFMVLLRERSKRISFDCVLKNKFDQLAEKTAKEILEDKSQKFWPAVKKEIDQKVEGSISPLLGEIFELILNKSFAKLREFLPKFPRDVLAREIAEDIKKMHPSNQNDQEEKKEESQEKG